MLFVHELHEVKGAHEDDFEAAFRDAGGWMQTLAQTSDDARLLWYLNQAHGSGPSYRVVTITAVRDGAAWQRLSERVVAGDLSGWAAHVDTLRHDVTAKVLVPVPWSPLQDLDLATVPTTAATHDLGLFMEDTGWPSAPLDDYVRFWGDIYYPLLAQQPARSRLLEIQACFQTVFGAGRRREAILWQKVHSYERLRDLLTTEVPHERKAPGTYMADALTYRDQWESRLLRTSSWSPLS
jgi:hypothetical protein